VSTVDRIPVELLLVIFYFFRPDITTLVSITHTCRRWRLIATETASLWTDVKLQIHPVSNLTAHGNSISLLDMQLERTGGLLLDVAWWGHIWEYCNPRILTIIRGKAPFSRWRKLELWLVGDKGSEDTIFSPTDIFTNLESLIIAQYKFDRLSQNISQRTTARLRIFEVGPVNSTLPTVVELLPHPMKHISCLIAYVPSNSNEVRPVLPPNIVELRTPRRLSHPFPYISTYELNVCLFRSDYTIDLQNLTTLTVISILTVFPECHVVLPSLRHLSYGDLRLSYGAKLETPMLESLRIMTGDDGDITTRIKNQYDALHHPGYLVSPKKSLFVELSLPEEGVALLLDRSPEVEYVLLVINDAKYAQKIMEEILIGVGTKGLAYRQSKWFCPRLSELRMNFEWEIGDVVLWKERSSKVVEARKENGVVLAIYASWEGEGTYVALS
jgi:hypothetical protein